METSKTDLNPYASTEHSIQNPNDRAAGHSILKSALGGAGWAVMATIPLAGLVGLCFRFPVPFVGYVSGPPAFLNAMLAAIFYGLVLGGWAVVGILGATSAVATRLAITNERLRTQVTRATSIAIALLGCLILATLDWYIGPF